MYEETVAKTVNYLLGWVQVTGYDGTKYCSGSKTSDYAN